MSMKKELVMEAIMTMMKENFDRYLEFDETKVADTVANQVVSEIQEVLQADYFYYDHDNYDEMLKNQGEIQILILWNPLSAFLRNTILMQAPVMILVKNSILQILL